MSKVASDEELADDEHDHCHDAGCPGDRPQQAYTGEDAENPKARPGVQVVLTDVPLLDLVDDGAEDQCGCHCDSDPQGDVEGNFKSPEVESENVHDVPSVEL